MVKEQKKINWFFNLVYFLIDLVIICLILMGPISCRRIASEGIMVGVGEEIITPPIGTPMAGYRRTDVSKGVHDDLYARSLILDRKDGQPILMMSLGIINLDYSYMDRIRNMINERTGIPKENIIISCTHTHSGPQISAGEYLEFLIERSVASALKAWENRVPGKIGTGSTVSLEVGRNDRRLEYGGLHPDPEVGIIKIENTKGKLLGLAFNYGCHPSALDLHNLEFTEDWPHYAIQKIKSEIGQNVWVAYFQSAQGDIKVGYSAELSAVGAEMPIRNFWWAEIKGKQMAEAVLKVLPDIITSNQHEIKVASDFFEFPLRESFPLSVKEAEMQLKMAQTKLAEMEKKAESIGKRVLDNYKVEVFLAELALNTARWVEKNPNPAPVPYYQQAVRIGDAIFVTFPCEVFSEIGLKVKKKSPLEKTFIIGLAGGRGGYIPTAEEYLEGGYAAVMTIYSPKCEEALINSSLNLISRVVN